MDAGGQSSSRSALLPPPVSVRDAAKDAARWAIVAFGLCFPIVLLRTDQNLSNRIVLNARPWLTLGLVLAVFGGRMLWLLTAHVHLPGPAAVAGQAAQAGTDALDADRVQALDEDAVRPQADLQVTHDQRRVAHVALSLIHI